MKQIRSNVSLIKCVWPYYKKNLKVFILDLLFTTLTAACDLIFPLIFKTAMDLIATASPSVVFDLVKLGIIHISIFIVEIIGIYYVNYIGHAMGSRIEALMRSDLFKHCQKLPMSYYNENKIGQLMSRLTGDLSEIGELAHHGPEDILIVFIKLVITFIILFNFNWWLTLIVYFSMSTMIFFIVPYFKKMKLSNQKNKVQLGELNAKIEDSLLGISLIKSFANEQFEQEKFEIENKKTLSTKVKFYKFFGLFKALNRIFSNLIYLIIIIIGSILLIDKQITVQELIVFTGYVTGAITAISKMLGFADIYQKGFVGINRFCEVMELPIEQQNCKSKLLKTNFNGDVEFKNVEFLYNKSSTPVLKNFNLKIKPNNHIAIIGKSGSGKTTMCNLLKKFYKVQHGEILIDGVNVNEIDSALLYQLIGVVEQNVYLFTGTILDNIKFAKPTASFEEIVQATKNARIFDFINSLDNKFETNIGERGTKLSGGQKQQISIARLFLREPKILILDEATSSLDSDSERIILDALNQLSKNKTTITVAHKLNIIKNSDVIYLLDDGKISESGSHSSLISNSNSKYSKLWKTFND